MGFASGELSIGNFTQIGNTAQTLTIPTGTSIFYLTSGTTFNGPVNFNFPQISLKQTTFNNSAIIEKNGASNNSSFGGNVFNGDATITNSGTGRMTLNYSQADDYNGNATFIQTGTGDHFPASNTNTTFAKDISTVGSTKSPVFGSSAGGIVTLDGTTTQNINGDLAFPLIINRLIINNGRNGLNLNAPLTVNNSLTLTSGNVNTSAINLLSLGSSLTTVTGVSDSSFVNGPVRKIGNTAFTFPTGKSNQYRPISISSPTTATDHFTAEYILNDPNTFYNVNSKDASIHHMSRTEYWTLNRTNGASNVSVTLSWNPFSGGVSRLSDLRVGRWDVPLSKWIDLGNGLTTGDTISGTIKTTSSTSTFGTFALGSSSASNTLPVELMFFSVEKDERSALLKWQTASEKNNDYFTIEKTSDGANFQTVGTVSGVGNSSVKNTSQHRDENPFTGTSYYRLKQTDFDGRFEIFKLVVFNLMKAKLNLKLTKLVLILLLISYIYNAIVDLKLN